MALPLGATGRRCPSQGAGGRSPAPITATTGYSAVPAARSAGVGAGGVAGSRAGAGGAARRRRATRPPPPHRCRFRVGMTGSSAASVAAAASAAPGEAAGPGKAGAVPAARSAARVRPHRRVAMAAACSGDQRSRGSTNGALAGSTSAGAEGRSNGYDLPVEPSSFVSPSPPREEPHYTQCAVAGGPFFCTSQLPGKLEWYAYLAASN